MVFMLYFSPDLIYKAATYFPGSAVEEEITAW